MDYSAGNLELSILGFSDKAVASIDVTAKALRRLASAIDKINNSQFVNAGNKLEIIFSKIAKSTNSINTQNITNLASAAKSLSSISRISNLDKLDFEKVGRGFTTLSTAIDPFLQKIKSAEASLNSLYGILQKANGKKIQGLLDGANGGSKKAKNGSFGFLSIAKWSAVIYAGRRLGRVVANIAQSGADYTETLNLWQVAMGKELLPQSEKFIEKLNEAYGISEKTLMNAQATFKNMLGGLGQISDEMAYKLSEGVTQMALDYASLYNVQFDQAFTKFQAALAGQVRPIRSVSGYDITENTLFQLYQELGGTKTMRQLSRTEKQLLSILAVFQQMDNTGAVGDLKKTIDSFANQSRITADSWDRILTFSGAILTNLIDSSGLLVQFNALLIFIGDTLKAIGESMGALEGVPDPFENATEGAEDLIKKTNEAYGLLDFDKIRALGGAEESASGLDKSILKGFEQYTSILEEARNSATELANTWKVASGLFDKNGVFDKEKWASISSIIVGIVTVLGASGLLSVVGKLDKKFLNLKGTITNAFSLKNIGIMALVSGLYYLYTTNEDFRESVNKLFEVLSNLLNETSQPLTDLFMVAGNSLATIANALSPILIFIVNITTAIIELLDKAGLIEPLVYGIISAIATLKITSFVNDLTKFFSNLMLKMVGLNGSIQVLTKSTQILFTTGISVLVAGVTSFLSAWDDMGNIQKAIGILSALVGVITSLVVGIHLATPAGWVKALGIGSLVAGSGLLVSSLLSNLGKFADGGLPDKGTMFYAGEAGAEIVYNTPSGQSGVANVQQIAQANYAGTTQALNDWWARARGDIPQYAPASDNGLYERVKAQANRRGDW